MVFAEQQSRTYYPQGLIVFFRTPPIPPNGQLANSVLPNARAVMLGRSANFEGAHEDDYVVIGSQGQLLGTFPREFVATILPINTIGPGAEADVNNPPARAQH